MSHSDVDRLLTIMARLRDPQTGCDWDKQQSFETIAPYTIEEAYEVADAIEQQDWPELQEELGDLLLQVVFHARMAEERGLFDFHAVVRTLNEKLIRRHPHVFAGVSYASEEELKQAWELQKVEERQQKGKQVAQAGVLAGVTQGLPALLRSQKLQKRAAKVGFDWNDPHAVLAKLQEESREVVEAVASGDLDAVEDEVGDLLFVLVNLARHLDVDAEQALRRSNRKFEQRIGHIEQNLRSQQRQMSDCELEELEALWRQAKLALAAQGSSA